MQFEMTGLWAALELILSSVPSEKDLGKKKLVLQASHSILTCKYPALQVSHTAGKGNIRDTAVVVAVGEGYSLYIHLADVVTVI